MNWHEIPILFGSAFLAGAINSVAGGGTLVTFPALLVTGMSAITANATSTVALWPGQLSSLWGYRKEIEQSRDIVWRLALPSFVGGIVGSLLLVKTTDSVFRHIVPYLILAATLLFLGQEPLSRWQRKRLETLKGQNKEEEKRLPLEIVERLERGDPHFHSKGAALRAWAGLMGFQFLVAIYGGYFGAGIGILQLAAFGLMGFTNIHRMNAYKNINGLFINGVASLLFIFKGLVDWKLALMMSVGAIIGGYMGAGTARKVGQKNVRKIVIAIGFGLAIRMFLTH